MNRKNEIKVYSEREDIELDYANFRQNWRFDAERRIGIHKSGMHIHYVWKEVKSDDNKTSLGLREKVWYKNFPEWCDSMLKQGLTLDEVNLYRRMLNNQFVIMVDRHQYKEVERRVKMCEKADNDYLNMLRTQGASQYMLNRETRRLSADRQKMSKQWEKEEWLRRSKTQFGYVNIEDNQR